MKILSMVLKGTASEEVQRRWESSDSVLRVKVVNHLPSALIAEKKGSSAILAVFPRRPACIPRLIMFGRLTWLKFAVVNRQSQQFPGPGIDVRCVCAKHQSSAQILPREFIS